MNDRKDAPDRRPLLYGLFAVAIVIVASYLFWPRGSGDNALVVTKEGVRSDTVASELTRPTDAATIATEIEDPPETETVALPADEGPVAETKIVEAPPKPRNPDPVARADSGGSQPSSRGDWVINLGSFSTRENADRRVTELARLGVAAHVSRSQNDDKTLFRVRVGFFETSEKAKEYGAWLKRSQHLDNWTGKR
jgi:cell division protein FtsN